MLSAGHTGSTNQVLDSGVSGSNLTTQPVKISHIGIAVSDLEKALSDFGKIFDTSSVELTEVREEGVRVAMITLGDAEIELLSPTGDSGAIAKFLKDRGEGIHHLAVKVDDVHMAIEKSKEKGLRMIDQVPRTGARGTGAAFVHPKSLHGVLLEFYDR